MAWDTIPDGRKESDTMEIATGYFAKAKVYSDMGYALVNIALKKPWFLADNLVLHQPSVPLCPNEEILALKDKPKEYEKRYREEILKYISPHEVYLVLLRIANEEQTDKVVLLCYESPEKFCHRHIVAKWLNESLGIKVSEADVSMHKESCLFASIL